MWVELRVHGVSGTPPESLLDFARVRQVAGDESSRIFRRVTEEGAELLDPGPHRVEAFHWGRFTSGSWTQAFWLLLAPFGVVNASQYMLPMPRGGGQRVLHAIAGSALRLLGLALTLLIVLAAAVVLVDLVSWQRVGGDLLLTGGTSPAYRWVAAGALAACGAVLVGLFLLSRSPRAADEREAEKGAAAAKWEEQQAAAAAKREAEQRAALQTPAERWAAERRAGGRRGRAAQAGRDGVDRDGARKDWELPEGLPDTDLVRPDFFGGGTDATPLRRLHLAAGLALLAAIGLMGVPGAPLWPTALALAVLAAVVLVVGLSGDPGRSTSVHWDTELLNLSREFVHGATRLVAPVLLAAGAAVFGFAVGAVFGFGAHAALPHHPGVEAAAPVAVYVAIGAVGVLALVTIPLAAFRERREGEPRQFRPYARGYATPLAASLGLYLGVGYTGAFTLLVANLLNAIGQVFDPAALEVPAGTPPAALPGILAGAVRPEVYPPEILSRIVYAWGLTAALVVVLMLVLGVLRQVSRRTLRQRVEADFGPGTLPVRWVQRIAGLMWAARTKGAVVPVLAVFAGAGLLLTLAAAAELGLLGGLARTLPVELSWLSGSQTDEDAVSGALLWIGTAVLLGLAGALVALGRSGLLGEQTRRGTSVVWDVVSFWPRAVHPYVPPAYSQWAVPALADRIRFHATTSGDPGRGVLVCGHSQGSLLSFAALLRLAEAHGPAALDRVGLLTFGSQLQVMFSRGFPGYVHFEAIRWMHERLGGAWRNLYRETDHLAGPVLSWQHETVPDAERTLPRRRSAIALPAGTGPEATVEAPPPDPDGTRRREFGADWCLPDPPLPDPRTPEGRFQTSPLLDPRRHGSYWRDAAWEDALDAIRGVSPGAVPESPAPESAGPGDPLEPGVDGPVQVTGSVTVTGTGEPGTEDLAAAQPEGSEPPAVTPVTPA